jgi:hypothetical protein
VRLNEFTGILPTQLTLLTKLSHLDCSWNELSGVFPRVPSSVTYLDIRANQFVGVLVGQMNTNPSNCKAVQNPAEEGNCFDAIPSGCGQNCVGGLTGVCTSSLPSITVGNSSTPSSFRACLNATAGSPVSLPKSYLFSPALPGLFALDVAPASNVSLLLNDTVLSVGVSTAFFFATTPLAISVRLPSATVRPVITVRACSCDGDSAVFSAALKNVSDSLVALSVNESLALQASLQAGRRVRGVFCAPAKHHYAVGVRAGTVVLKFDRLSIFATGKTVPAAQTALSLYLVPASGGTAISRVVELNVSAPLRPADVHLSPFVAPTEEAVLVVAASVPLMYAVSFTLADCLMGDDSTQALSVGARVVSSICPAGDRDTFSAEVQAGNFTLTVDIGDQVLSAPLQLKATLSVYESAVRQNLTAQPACVLEAFVAHNVSSCTWALEQSAGFLSIELAADTSNVTLVGYGVVLAFVPRATPAPTPAPATTSTSPVANSTGAPPAGGCDKLNGTDCHTLISSATSAAAAETPSAGDSKTIYVAVGVAVGAACLIGGVVLIVLVMRRRRQTSAPAITQQQAVSMSEFTSARFDGDGVSPYASTAQAFMVAAPSIQSGMTPKSEYASTAAGFTVNATSPYGQLTRAESGVDLK